MSQLVLTLDSNGTPNRWRTWEDVVVAKCKNLVAWSIGDEVIHYGGTTRSGDRSTMGVPSIVAIRGETKHRRQIPPLTNRNLFGRDLNTCAYCGKVFDHTKLTRDHIIPKSRGGKNTFMNCVTACKRCNSHKDANLLEECNMELLYVPYVPNKAEGLILANRRILADQMEFLLNHVPKHSRIPLLYQ